jgi:Flp pilus assembly pilin Flp
LFPAACGAGRGSKPLWGKEKEITVEALYSLYVRTTVALGSPIASLRREEGQTFTEYAIIVATIAVGTVVAVGFLRDSVTNALSDAANAI